MYTLSDDMMAQEVAGVINRPYGCRACVGADVRSLLPAWGTKADALPRINTSALPILSSSIKEDVFL